MLGTLALVAAITHLAPPATEAACSVARTGERYELRLRGKAFHESAAEPAGLREIRVNATNAVVVLWSEADEAGRPAPFYAISLDGERVARVGSPDAALGLTPGGFDPVAGAPEIAPALASGDEQSLFIVQFATPAIEPYFDELRRAGAERLSYLPQQAFVVRMDAAARAAVAAMPFVRWVGPYHPSYRLDDESRLDALSVERAGEARRYNILLVEKTDRAKARAATTLLNAGAVIDNPDAGARLIEATLTPEQLRLAAGLDDVLFIDRWGPPETDMDIARSFSGAQYFHDTLGLTGEGVRAEVMDNGVRRTHQDFSPQPLIHGPNADQNAHGTSTYGINFGDGVNCGRGILPAATGIFADYGYVSSHYNHAAELVNPALQWKAVYQTNSWGSTETTNYTTTSASTDDIAFDHDLAIFRSQGNVGTTSSRPQAWAKNVISVGGILHRNSLTTADDCWCDAGSTGPASDGRIKPDLAHFYDSVATTDAESDIDCTLSFGGTSAATPITAGHAGLWFQFWHSGALGNTPGATVFDSRPHASLTKAMLIAAADQWNFSGTGHDLTRTHQGWGRVNIRNISDDRARIFWVNETDVLTPFQTREYRLAVAAAEPALRAVLVYKDPPGNPAVQSQHRVNNLDLELVTPNGLVTYRGNVGLDAAVWSAAGGAADTKNTVECVFIPVPAAGTWTVRVTATEINEDSHVQSPALDADFSLVVRGVNPVPIPPICPGDADGDRLVGLSDIALMIQHWNQSVPPLMQGDLTGDGLVTLADASLVIMYWGIKCP